MLAAGTRFTAAGCSPSALPSDTVRAQRADVDPLLPDPHWQGRGGFDPRNTRRRQIVDATSPLVDNGIEWCAVPAGFLPWSTVCNSLAAWEAIGVT